MTRSRWSFSAVAFAAATLVASGLALAQAPKTVKIRVQSVIPTTADEVTMLKEFAADVAALTSNTVTFEVLPAGAVVAVNDTLDAVDKGLIEGGFAWVPHVMWRLDKNWKALRSECPWLTRPPSEIIREHFRLSTQPIEEPDNDAHLLQLFAMMDAEHTLMFSSDYPHWDFDSPTQAFPRLPPELKRRIFVENARELYGL